MSPAAPSGIRAVGSSGTFVLPAWNGDPGSPEPIMDCRDAAGTIGASDPVAIVRPHGQEVALRDYVDLAHPRTLCRFSNQEVVQLVDSRHLVVKSPIYATVFALVDLPDMTHHWFDLQPRGSTGGSCTGFLGVSPGLDAVAWRTYDLAGGAQAIHVTGATGDRVVATLPTHPSYCTSRLLIPVAAYSASGRFLFILDREAATSTFDSARTSLLVLDGSQTRLRLTPPTGGWAKGDEPSMPVWSPVTDTLYYQQRGGIWMWTPEVGSRPYLQATSWCYPTFSSDGRYLAYGLLRSDSTYQVDLIDLQSRSTGRPIGKGTRNVPAFLNSTLIWYETWPFVQCGEAGVGNETWVAGAPLVYDTADGSETPSALDEVYELWPATGYGYSGAWPGATTTLFTG